MNVKIFNSYDFSKWDHCKTFKDLLKENIKFIKGIYKTSPYHAAPIYDMDNSKLLHINKNGFLTINGQSNDCQYFKYVPKTKYIYYHNNILENEIIDEAYYESHEYKSYLDGYIEKYMLNNLIIYLDFIIKKHKIPIKYQFYDFDDNKLYTNLTRNTYRFVRNSSTQSINKKSKIIWDSIGGRLNKDDYVYNFLRKSYNLKTVFKTEHKIDNVIYFELLINKYCHKIILEDILTDFIKYNKLFKYYRK